MRKNKLGNTTLDVAPLAFGGNVFGWTIDEKTSFDLLDQFVAAGYNLIDTADVYSRWASGIGGESETIIGKWLKSRNNRAQVIIATKVGSDMGDGKKGLSKRYIAQAVEASLKRLQTDYIDLYQSHWDDPETPFEDTLEAYQQLIQAGKVRFIGASNLTAARLTEALEASKKFHLPRYETLQPLYNLYDREVFEKELQPLCEKENISVISYYSLASGFLTGKYRSEADLSKSVRGNGNKKYLNEKGFSILKALDEVAAQHHTTPTSIALAWLQSRKTVAAPIASATSSDQLKALLHAAELSLTASELALLSDVVGETSTKS